MKVTVNHVTIELAESATLQDALDTKGIAADGVATAVNGTVIPKAKRQAHELSDGDDIVVIKAFYGG